MVYLTIQHIEGDSDELLQQKQEMFDPVIRHLPGHNQPILSITAKTDQGLMVIDAWESADVEARFRELLEIRRARRLSGLPLPSGFERYDGVLVDDPTQRRDQGGGDGAR